MLLLRPVKARALNQGKAKALVPPTLILQVKAKRARKARKARRVKRVQTPKATRAKKGRRVNMPGPSWKVARVQPKGTQNNRFSPSFHPLPPVSFFPPSTPLTNSFHLCPSVSPPFTSFSHPSPAYSFASFRQQDSVGHSGPLGPWFLPFSSPRPSRSFRRTRSTACFLSLSPASGQLGLSRSFRPTQSPAASVLVFTSLFYASPPLPRLSRSFRPTRSLATSSLFLASALPFLIVFLGFT